jgi:hypothetical protein
MPSGLTPKLLEAVERALAGDCQLREIKAALSG